MRYWSLLLLVLTLPCPAHADKKNPAKGDSKGTVIDDPVQPFKPRRPRSEQETDRVTAAAYFAQGRVLFQRRNLPDALRNYQRAYRFDPEATAILGDIVSISFRLNHQFEAYRYAALAAEKTSSRRQLVIGMAAYMTDQNNFSRAIKLYQKGLKLTKKDPSATLPIQLEMGRLCFLDKRYADAAKHFDTIRKVLDDPKALTKSQRDKVVQKPSRTYTMFGLAYLLAKRSDEAEKMFRQVNKLDPSSGRLAYHLARVAFVKKDYPRARKWLNEYIQLKATESGNSPYQLLDQVLAATEKDKKKATKEFLTILAQTYKTQPKNLDLGLLLAARQFTADQLKASAKLFRSLLNSSRKETAREGLLQVAKKQGDAAVLLEQITASVVTKDRFRSLTPSGRLIATDKKLTGKVIELAKQKTAKDESDTGQLWTPLAAGLLALEAKNFDQAKFFLTAAIKHKKAPRAELLISWALSLMTKKTAKQAIPLLQKIIDEKLRSKDHPSIMLQLATAYQLAGDKTKAIRVARQAAALSPKSLAVRTEFAGVLFRIRALADAEKEYLRILKSYDKDHRSSQNRAYVRQARLVLSTICVLTNRMAEGEEWLQQVLDEYPEHVGAQNDLGYLWCDQGKHLQRSRQMVQYAVKAEPQNAAYRDSLGWVLYRLGKYKQAVVELQKAVKLSGQSPDAVILDHLGDAHLKAGQKKEARKAFQKAVKSFDESEQDKKLATEKKIKALK